MDFLNSFFRKKINRKAAEISSVAVASEVAKIKRQCGFVRGYEGGGWGSKAGGAKFRDGLNSSGGPLVINHWQTRQNARRAYQDTTAAKAIVDRFADTVADRGLKFESTPRASILGIAESDAEKWASDVETRFDAWATDKQQHRSETVNFYQAQRQWAISQQRDGDTFVRLHYASDKNLQSPLQFSFIDPNQILSDGFTAPGGINYIPGAAAGYFTDGIEYDARGRPQKYNIWIQKLSSPGSFESVKIEARGAKSGRLYMLHAFAPEYAGQTRGYSRLAHALQDFRDVTDFSESQIRKAVNQASIFAYVKPSPNNPASNPLETIMAAAGAGPASSEFGSNPVPGGVAENVTDESINPVSCYQLPEARIDVPGSMMVANLEEGEELRPGPANAPADSYDRFVDAFTAYISASMSIPIEVVLMRFNQNYSASRASLILFWRISRIWQAEMASDILFPVVKMWLAEEISAGRVFAPGWQDPVLQAAWLHGRWIGAPMPNIDPKRTADADKTYVEMGAQTLDEVALNFNGSDGRTNRAKLTREFSELPPAPWSKNNPVVTTANPDKTEQKEEEKDNG